MRKPKDRSNAKSLKETIEANKKKSTEFMQKLLPKKVKADQDKKKE